MANSPPDAPSVLRCDRLNPAELTDWVARHGMWLQWVAADAPIPGSYWGDEEAGLIGDRLYVRPDTPVHSLLHELGHWLCMDATRRAAVHTDACGTDTEENAVCYLQALLADDVPGYSQARLLADMDAWGYHFISGSARAWLHGDSDDAQAYLRAHDLLDSRGCYTGSRRET
jgi:hypothetical protein